MKNGEFLFNINVIVFWKKKLLFCYGGYVVVYYLLFVDYRNKDINEMMYFLIMVFYCYLLMVNEFFISYKR